MQREPHPHQGPPRSGDAEISHGRQDGDSRLGLHPRRGHGDVRARREAQARSRWRCFTTPSTTTGRSSSSRSTIRAATSSSARTTWSSISGRCRCRRSTSATVSWTRATSRWLSCRSAMSGPRPTRRMWPASICGRCSGDVHGMPFGTVPAGTGEHLGRRVPGVGDACGTAPTCPGSRARRCSTARSCGSGCAPARTTSSRATRRRVRDTQPAGAVSADRYGTITIRDNDEPPVLAWTDTTVDEATPSRSRCSSNPPLRQRDATVEWTTVDGTAAGTPPGGLCTAGSGRYVQDSGTLTFAPDETERRSRSPPARTTPQTATGPSAYSSAPRALAALPSGDDAASVQIKDDD